jgi:uncharacterized protein
MARRKAARANDPVTVGGAIVPPGTRRRSELPVARLFTQTQVSLPIEVVNGSRPGPRLWLSAALHGDELNGVEIIQRVLEKLSPAKLAGEVIAVPVVNVFGFVHRTRHLPDGRDLNRCFPGSPRGSLASRLAHLFMTQVVSHSTHGIDLHTAGERRENLPQVRANIADPETRRIAQAFAAPCMIHGDAPHKSLREVCSEREIPILVYEAGEPHRFNAGAISIGIRGVLRVMAELGMIRRARREGRRRSMEARKRTWIRARRSGILRLRVRLGQWVDAGEPLGQIHDAFGSECAEVLAPQSGLVIGVTHHPLVNQGDALVHLATQVETIRV